MVPSAPDDASSDAQNDSETPDHQVERSWRPAATARPVTRPDVDRESSSDAPTAPDLSELEPPDAPVPPTSDAPQPPDRLPQATSPEEPPPDSEAPEPDSPRDAASTGQASTEPAEHSQGPDDQEGPPPSAQARAQEIVDESSAQAFPGEDDPPAEGEAGEGDAETASDDAPEDEGKRINEEAFADADRESNWTDQVERPSPPDAASPDDGDFLTDETRRGSPADRVEEAIQDAAYRQNEGDADTDWTPRERRDRKIATTFALLVSKVAEDMSYQQQPGDEFWDPRKIMRRQIDNRPLRHCKMEYTKRRLALLVDTSPSCRDEAVFYSKIASGAMLRDDIDIFLCPNGRIDAKFDPEPMRFVRDDRGGDWGLEGRTVLYFTDWDGHAQLVRHSRDCTLYWFDNADPERYWESRREHHQRVRLRYRGRHFHCPDPDAFQRLVRKIRP